MSMIVIQKCVPFLVRSLVQASNRSGIAVQQGVHKPSCSTWALWRGLGRRSAWKTTPYSNSSPCASSSGQQTKFCLSFSPIMHSKGSPMIIPGLILISSETDRQACMWQGFGTHSQPEHCQEQVGTERSAHPFSCSKSGSPLKKMLSFNSNEEQYLE